VALIKPEAPIVGTGMEATVARDSGQVVLAEADGMVDSATAENVVVTYKTGETKTYQAIATNNEMGTFNNPRVITPFSWDGRTWGAWELAARYSDLDLNWHAGSVGTACTGILLGCIRGGEEKIWSVGLNWYLNNNVLMRFNYLIADVNKLNAAGQQIGQKFNVMAIRLQYSN